MLARWLEQFAGSAGGALFSVTGNATPALARIQNELSSYYLLGVEPADEDRNGRTHEVAVKTTQANVTVRGRRWVMIPARGAAHRRRGGRARGRRLAVGAAARCLPRRAASCPPDVVAMADVFDRGNAQAFQSALAQSADLPNVIRDFRQSDSPWPANRRRTAVFALELGLAGLRSDNRDARDEGGRLLAEYHVRVREPAGADEFECWWLVTETTALEGLFMPDNALLFIPRALQRCPANPRLQLAYALVSEQQWLQGRTIAAQEAGDPQPLRTGDEVSGDRDSKRASAPHGSCTGWGSSTAGSPCSTASRPCRRISSFATSRSWFVDSCFAPAAASTRRRRRFARRLSPGRARSRRRSRS